MPSTELLAVLRTKRRLYDMWGIPPGWYLCSVDSVNVRLSVVHGMSSGFLFKLGDWEIVTAGDLDVEAGYHAYAIHMACKSDDGEQFINNHEHVDNVSWLASEAPVCWNCNIPVPEEIQGLLRLYQFGVETGVENP